MAAVSLETTELETLFEAALTGKKELTLDVLNAFRVKNGKTAINSSELAQPDDSAWRTALAGVQADLDA